MSFTRYQGGERRLDRRDMNRRATVLEGLMKSAPANSYVGQDGIVTRQPGQRRPKSGSPGTPALVQSSASDGSNQWTYQLIDAELSSQSYSAWSAKSGATAFTARNSAEVGNTATMVGGVDISTPTDDSGNPRLTGKPIPNGAQVWYHSRKSTGGTAGYWFDRPNPIQQDCS